MNPALILGIIFVLACCAFCTAMCLIEANANMRQLEAELVRLGKVAEHLRKAAAEAKLDCYQRHAELYGDKPNA